MLKVFIIIVLPSAKVTTNVWLLSIIYPIALATSLLTKLWVTPESTIQQITRPLHTVSNYSRQGQSSCFKCNSFGWTSFCKVGKDRGLHPTRRAAQGLGLLWYGHYYRGVITTSSPAKNRDSDTPSLQTLSKGESSSRPANELLYPHAMTDCPALSFLLWLILIL